MPKYIYACPRAHIFITVRPISDRDRPIPCPAHPHELAQRHIFAEFQTQYIPPHLDRKLWTQWGDVSDRSERELARDPTISRYDPTTTRPDRTITADKIREIQHALPRHELEELSRKLAVAPLINEGDIPSWS